MENNKKWDILTLSGNSEDIDILSSYIFDKSLGGYISEDKYFYYFDSNQRDVIENILNKYIDKFQFSFLWGTQDYEDWHLSWKENFKPIKIDNKLIIIPDWDQCSYDFEFIIKIKPGMAFGTGHHETTFLILKYLMDYVNPGSSVLDLGSGSGILSIAAHIYGAKDIIAVESDIDCKNNFFENLQINNINKSDITLLIEDVLSYENFNYDIILANINKNIIKRLIPRLKNIKATILLSGILAEDQIEVQSLLNTNSMKLIHKDQYNEWLLMVVQND